MGLYTGMWLLVSSTFADSPDICPVLTYIGTAAQSYGIPASEAYTIVSIANAASFVGRLSTGYLADKYPLLLALL